MALHSVWPGDDPSGSGVDVDADAGFFEMSPAGAEQVTLQIRSMMERAWEYIAIAFQGRAHIALGYESWDEYVDDRSGDLRLTVPREERGAVVQSLSRAQLSLRAIAKVLGVDVATVHRALGASSPTESGERDDAETAPIQGRDGKRYLRRRRTAVITCSFCGDVHDAGTVECPWDLFADGRGPRPVHQKVRLGMPDRRRGCADAVEVEERREHADGVDADGQPKPATADGGHAGTIVESVTRAVCLVDELATLPQLVDAIEVAGVSAGEAGLADGIRELIERLRFQAEAIMSLAHRLERVCGPIGELDRSTGVQPVSGGIRTEKFTDQSV
jgi:hypothetical protein